MSKGEQTLSTSLPDNPDGFRIALDTSRERADIVLQRPPLNVVAMPQANNCDRLSKRWTEMSVFVSSYSVPKENTFRRVATSRASWNPLLKRYRTSRLILQHRHAALNRLSQPFGVIALESVLNCVWPATFVCAARQHCLHYLNSESRRYPDLVDRYVCCT